MALSAETLAAVQRYGPSVESIAKQYGISGSALLAKLVTGESGDSGTAVSSAGAKGWAQFMPGSRKIAMDKYGVDPWADVDQAVHAASLHLRGKINGSTGLKGYNPGSPTYTNYILGQKVGNVAGGVSRASSPGSTPGAAAGPSGSGRPAAPGLTAPGTAGDFTGLLGQLLARPEPVQQMTPVAPPSFSARAPVPQGFQAPTPGPQMAPAQADPVAGALSLLETLRGTDPASADPGAAGAAGGPAETVVTSVMRQRAAAKRNGGVVPLGGSKNAGQGSFEVDGPNPGRLKPELTSFAEKVAAVLGAPLVGKDGSTHSKYTVNGNVSEHYSGNATDIFEIGGKPATGERLIRAGQAALIAAGMPRAEALKQRGGLFNVGAHQIIFHTDGVANGGNHMDHLHISARA